MQFSKFAAVLALSSGIVLAADQACTESIFVFPTVTLKTFTNLTPHTTVKTISTTVTSWIRDPTVYGELRPIQATQTQSSGECKTAAKGVPGWPKLPVPKATQPIVWPTQPKGQATSLPNGWGIQPAPKGYGQQAPSIPNGWGQQPASPSWPGRPAAPTWPGQSATPSWGGQPAPSSWGGQPAPYSWGRNVEVEGEAAAPEASCVKSIIVYPTVSTAYITSVRSSSVVITRPLVVTETLRVETNLRSSIVPTTSFSTAKRCY